LKLLQRQLKLPAYTCGVGDAVIASACDCGAYRWRVEDY